LLYLLAAYDHFILPPDNTAHSRHPYGATTPSSSSSQSTERHPVFVCAPRSAKNHRPRLISPNETSQGAAPDRTGANGRVQSRCARKRSQQTGHRRNSQKAVCRPTLCHLVGDLTDINCRFAKQPKDAIKTTLEMIAERVGTKNVEKRWLLKSGF